MSCWDTIVVGAGPAGLLYALNSRGSTLILEQWPKVGYKPHCTGLVSYATAKLLPKDAWITEFKHLHLLVGKLYISVNTSLVWIARPLLENILADHLESEGIVLRLKCRVVSVKASSKEHRVYTTCGSFTAKKVVIAEGALRSLARKAPAELQPVKYRVTPSMQYVIVNARLREGVFALIPWTSVRYTWIVCSERKCMVGSTPAQRELLEAIHKLVGGRKVEVRSGLVVESIPPRRLCSRGICVVGDAAGMVKSLTNGGLYAIARVVPHVARGRHHVWKVLRASLVRNYVLAKAAWGLQPLLKLIPGLLFKIVLEDYDQVRVAWLETIKENLSLKRLLRRFLEQSVQAGYGSD